MENQKTREAIHEKAMGLVNNLRHTHHYEEATEMVRMSSCKHLRLLDLRGIKEQGIDSYYDIRDILLSSSEDFGDREDKKESYKAWDKKTEKKLEPTYKCELTGRHCVSRTTEAHYSDYRDGNNNQSIANLDIQMRCPKFEFRKNLLDRLSL